MAEKRYGNGRKLGVEKEEDSCTVIMIGKRRRENVSRRMRLCRPAVGREERVMELGRKSGEEEEDSCKSAISMGYVQCSQISYFDV